MKFLQHREILLLQQINITIITIDPNTEESTAAIITDT